MTTLSLCTIGQTKVPQRTAQDLRNLLSQKWQLTHMEVDGQRLHLPFEMRKAFMTLNTDGTFTENNGEDLSKGKWAFEHKTMILSINDRDGKEKHKIIKITSEVLVLKTSYEGIPMNMIMERIKG